MIGAVSVGINRVTLRPWVRRRWRWRVTAPDGFHFYGYTWSHVGAWLTVWRVARREAE